MDRLACVDVPALPLQILLRDHPDWKDAPAAVVDQDKPQGRVLWANEQARRNGVLPGIRYGQALSLAPELHAGTLEAARLEEGVTAIRQRLLNFSPRLEVARQEPGVFWLDAGGFEGLFGSLAAWAESLRGDLSRAGWVAAVAVGFTRFGSYAAARLLKGRRSVVFERPEREVAVMHGAPLELVGLPPASRDALQQLGVRRVGDLLRLPAQGLLRRFDPAVHDLYRFASGELDIPVQSQPLVELPRARLELAYREDNAERLVFVIKPLVDRLLAELARRGLALVELQLRLGLDDTPEQLERLATAEPTLSSPVVMELVALRLGAAALSSPAVEILLEVLRAEPASQDQLRLFGGTARRDLGAAARAFARLRAAFGRPDVVARATLRDRHTPEGRFAWEPLDKLEPAHPQPRTSGTLVRRILAQAEPLPPLPAGGPRAWTISGPSGGGLQRLMGPYRLCGGWWSGELERDYYFGETDAGELLWVYYDHLRRGWYLQGEVS